MDKVPILLLCIVFFYCGYYDYPSPKMKINPEDNEYERNYKKIDNSRSLILMVVSVVVFVVAVINIIFEFNTLSDQ